MKQSAPEAKKPGFFAKLGLSKKAWQAQNVTPAQQINESDAYRFGSGMTTVATLYGYGRCAARTRDIIYRKWLWMEGDPIVSAALKLLVTASLGGHETNSDVIFIEKKPAIKDDKKLSAVVDDIAESLSDKFNKIAFTQAFIGAVYGDAYARVYTRDGEGVTDIMTDELIRPPLVQPFEQGGRTVGFAVMVGERNFVRLDVSQMVRLKMQRTQWIPQYGVLEKSLSSALEENDPEELPILPSLVGGSLLFNAEKPFDDLMMSLLGLVGQRWIDSIDEQLMTVNLKDTSKDQQEKLIANLAKMLSNSKARAEDAVKQGRPVLERVRHLLPVWEDKQIVSLGNMSQTGRANSITIDDVLFHAKLLAGAIGIDISMLGFADQLSGGLGEGGFFRTSAQAAQSARFIRSALTDFYNKIIDLHTLTKYGIVFNPGDRPWQINFFGSISAAEAEQQRTRADAMNAGMLVAQTMQQLKDMGATKDVMVEFLTKTMMLDEDQAKLYATIVDAKPQDEGGEDGGGGGFGGR